MSKKRTPPKSPKGTGKTSADVVKDPMYQNPTKAPEQTSEPLIVNEIVLRNLDTTPKDIGTLQESYRMGSSIYFPQRSRLYDLYRDVERDGHYTGVWERRQSAAVNKRYKFVDANREPVENICKLIESTEFQKMLKEVLTHITWGIDGIEFIPGEKFAWKAIDKKHIKPEKKVIAINQTDTDGISYEDISNIWVIGDDRDLGLLLKVSFYVLLKKGNFTDWANYIEMFGQPMVVAKYDSYDEKTKAQLTRLMQEIGNSLRVSMPKQAELELIDAKTSNGNGDLQDKFAKACDEQISKIILTVTETTGSSKSSGFAQSKTHSEQQFEITKDDIKTLLGLMNSDKFRVILKSYGYNVDGGEFIVEMPMSIEDQLNRVQVLDTAHNKLGLPIDHDSIYEELGMTKPADYDKQIAQMQADKMATQKALLGDQEDAGEEDDPKPPTPGKKPGSAPKPGNLYHRSLKYRLLSTLADFFDPALPKK